jgi:hypothetical protein
MFEFEKKPGELSGYTLIVPAVSVGNVGKKAAVYLIMDLHLHFSAVDPDPQISETFCGTRIQNSTSPKN